MWVVHVLVHQLYTHYSPIILIFYSFFSHYSGVPEHTDYSQKDASTIYLSLSTSLRYDEKSITISKMEFEIVSDNKQLRIRNRCHTVHACLHFFHKLWYEMKYRKIEYRFSYWLMMLYHRPNQSAPLNVKGKRAETDGYEV